MKGFGFYNWCKKNTACEGYSSPVSPVSPASSDKNDSYDDEPLALIVPSKRRLSDLETSLKSQINKMYHARQISPNENSLHINSIISNMNNNSNHNNNTAINNNNNNIVNNNISPHNNTIINNNNSQQMLSVEEALQHGEVFLDWLKASSDPNVTVFQAMQIGTLIRNIRSSLERNQNRR